MAKINREILKNVYGGTSPYTTSQPKYVDNNYPHTNIKVPLIDFILKSFNPTFWLEIGSFVGGSALKVAECIRNNKLDTGIICCDPFCGDVNMWDWEIDSNIRGNNGKPYKFLGLEDGIPTVYQRFIANVFYSGFSDTITPIQSTSIVSIKLIERLFVQKRIAELPTVVYLDSAHQEDETFLELVNAWKMLPKGGILFGDDWGWDAVRKDVIKFSETISIDTERQQFAQSELTDSTIEKNIFLFDGQWVLFKPRN